VCGVHENVPYDTLDIFGAVSIVQQPQIIATGR